MAELNLTSAIERISSSTVKERADGIADLKHILQHNLRTPRRAFVSDKSFHTLYEALFRLASTERAQYLKANKSAAKETVKKRLDNCAEALRLALQIGVRTIRAKTVKAVLDHVTHTLPHPGGGYFQPLLTHYLKCVQTILEHQAHVEHMASDDWKALAMFCIEGVRTIDDSDAASNRSSNGHSSFQTANVSTGRSSRSITTEPQIIELRDGDNATNAQELVICLRMLTAAPNAPVVEIADAALTELIAFLQSSKRVGRAHRDALSAVGSILSVIGFENISIAQRSFRQLLPIMKDLWLSRTAMAIKDDILVIITQLRAHLSNMIKSADDAFLQEIEGLVDTFRSEYRARRDREQLQIDDIRLQLHGETFFDTPLHTKSFCLRPSISTVRVENHWVVLCLIADLSFQLSLARDSMLRGKDMPANEDDYPPLKRVRPNSLLADYLRDLVSIQPSDRVVALQVLSFLADQGILEEIDTRNILDRSIACVSDKSPEVSSWAFISISSAAFQKASKSKALSSVWTNIWQLACRHITNSSTCRSACHVMDVLLRLELVQYASVHESIESIFLSLDLNGPAILAESSMSLFVTIMNQAAAANPSSTKRISERIVGWLFGKWLPSLSGEKTFSTYVIHSLDTIDLFQTLGVCLDHPIPFKHTTCVILGPIGRASVRAQKFEALASYLVQVRGHDTSLQKYSTRTQSKFYSRRRSQNSSLAQPHAVESKILESLTSEVEKSTSRIEEWSADRPQNLTQSMLRNIASLCIVSFSMSHLLQNTNALRADSLQKRTASLIKIVCATISRKEASQSQIDGVLEALSSMIPSANELFSQDDDFTEQLGISQIALPLSRALDEHKNSIAQSQFEIDDEMDIDDEFDSQQSRDVAHIQGSDFPRTILAADYDVMVFRASVNTFSRFVSSQLEELDNVRRAETVPQSFIHYFLSLSGTDLLMARPFIGSLSASAFQFSADDIDRMLGHLAEELLASYEFNHHEVSLSFCLEFMTEFSSIWTDESNRLLFNTSADIYEWLMDKVLVKKFASPELQVRFSELLYSVLKTCPEYAKTLNEQPSIRTSLFQLLQDGSVTVKYHIGIRLSRIFKRFVLAKHDDVFEDVFDNLPKAGDWPEGIAIRLLILSKLGAAWPTLLRRCVYHIYETAGLLSFSTPHATICVQQLCDALKLSQPRLLFNIFSPQLIYTWLETQDLKTIPFLIFGYTTLPELLEDAQDEIFAQAMMRGQQQHIDLLCSYLKRTQLDTLRTSFGKVAAYSIACDVSLQRKSDQSSEAVIRRILGKEQSELFLKDHFPEIIGHLFLLTDQLKAVVKGFSQSKNSATALQEIEEISCSTNPLPAEQQPNFNSRFLTAQITRLSHRVGYKPDGVWIPSIFVFILRMLLSRILPVLGSLHACSVIRKIRILVSMAGEAVLSGYPLHMTLHSLRPFLTDSQCADDTLGIVQYLFHHGRAALTTQLSFMTGVALSTLISLRSFLSSSQESTTQESQYQATMSKARAFHSWFAKYLETYIEEARETASHAKSHYKAFQVMILAALDIRTEGDSVKDSAESRLLLALLDDDRSERKLLNEPAKTLAFSLLCQQFQPAKSLFDDVLGSDLDAARFAAQVLQSCKRKGVGEGYLIWAAKVLGRTFASQGEAPAILRTVMRQAVFSTSEQVSPKGPSLRSSRTGILNLVAENLFSDSIPNAGVAEFTLRQIIARSAAQGETDDIDRSLPQMTISALSLSSSEKSEAHRCIPSFSITNCTIKMPIQSAVEWIQEFSVALAKSGSDDAMLGTLPRVLLEVPTMAESAFPYILHITLLRTFADQNDKRKTISGVFDQWLRSCREETVPHVRILLRAVVYLRSQPVPRETTRVDREHWLDLDYSEATTAAIKCGFHRLALLFMEIHTSQINRSTRHLQQKGDFKVSTNLQLEIYQNLDEPDFYYGVEQEPSLSSILHRLEHEGDGAKSLFLRGARMDSQFRRMNKISPEDSHGMLQSLTMLNLNSVTDIVLSGQQAQGLNGDAFSSLMYTARKLEKWDVRLPETSVSETSIIFRAFQSAHNCTNIDSARNQINTGLAKSLGNMISTTTDTASFESYLRTFGVLTEMDEIFSVTNPEQFRETWERQQSRNHWMGTGRLENIRPILSCRETLFSVMSQNAALQEPSRISESNIREVQAIALLTSSDIYKKHGALQESLASATYLADIADECGRVGVPVLSAAEYELADVLWEQGETAISIRMLQGLVSKEDPSQLHPGYGRCQMFTKLGTHVADARLENPDAILRQYLQPAIHELKGEKKGRQAAEAFHTFAAFCDAQLSNGEIDEDIQRTQNQAQRKYEDAEEFDRLAKMAKGQQRDHMRSNARRAKKVADIDMQEYQRLRGNKETFLCQCLENYLLALQASDTYNNDVLRVFSLWLEYSNTPQANEAMGKYLGEVPSGKFAGIMNQLSSRLQAEQSEFQTLLSDLVFRICLEHPYHGLHHIFAGIMSLGVRDEAAKSRNAAAKGISQLLKKHERSRRTWAAIHDSDYLYHEIAMISKDEFRGMNLRELTLDKLPGGRKIAQKVPTLRVPPATLSIEVRQDCDYSNVPVITAFRSRVSIAGGLSAPKILRVTASDGVEHRQLFKSGSDDMRQDAIMEQVFEHSSTLLKKHTATRVRNLHIRTYKVLPLSARSGMIEFVQSTISLADVLIPMHHKYNPKDYRSDQCRKIIEDAQKSSIDTRVKEFRRVQDHFSPVMRYFFIERFENPDDWFERRLAYTRTTAAISILGWVLGLGDRHCQNILLDERRGEVVHIDLGVAFEMGRILPVPELVPFRLTRDLVDGMGYSKTEGVFRRCCEFTLDTLREERESIMILLNVLRYDPLVSWSISPLKAKRMQEQQDQQQPEGPVREYEDSKILEQSPRKKEIDSGDAGRALAVVEKKLSRGLSTAATVSGLIQQATDVKNLAVLFCGWAAHC